MIAVNTQLAQMWACMVMAAHSIGYTVSIVDEAVRDPEDEPIPEDYYCAGYTDYAHRTIQIATDHPADMIMVLAHEIGHALAARRMGVDRLDHDARRRFETGERRAYLYGWAVVRRHLGDQITRDMWRSEHAFIDGVPQTGPVPSL